MPAGPAGPHGGPQGVATRIRASKARVLLDLWARAALCAVLLGIAITASTAWAADTRIWYERGVAVVTTGFDSGAGRFVAHKFYLVVHGPDGPPGVAHDAARACTSEVVSHVGEAFRVRLWEVKPPVPAAGETSVSPAAREAAAAARDQAVDARINEAIGAFRVQMNACAANRFDAGLFQLGLIQRVCDSRAANCTNAPLALAADPAAQAFSILSLWIDARDGQNATLPANRLVLLPDLAAAGRTLSVLKAKDADEVLIKCRAALEAPIALKPGTSPTATPGASAKPPSAVITPRPPTCLALEMAMRPFEESSPWPEPQPATVRQAQLEALMARVRKTGGKIESSVPRLLEMPRQVALRMIDVISEPQTAMLDLKDAADATLLTMSDEIARSRLTECARFKGLNDA